MPGPENDRMEALSEAIVRLLKRVDQTEARLAQLERLLPAGVVPHAEPPVIAVAPPTLPPPLPVTVEPGVQTPTPEPAVGEAIPAFARTAETVAETAVPQPLETRMGLTWLNRIGVLTLIIGVGFFFKYAIDNQWIGETGRVVLGVLAGLATLAAGDILWRRNQKVFAQGVCGLGVSILYLSFYASFAFYHLLPQTAAFVLMMMVTAMAGALALRYDSMAIAALGMLGGYATPLLLSTGQDAPWTFFSYILVIDVGAVAIARRKSWRPLNLMAFAATAILYISWFGEWFKPEKEVVATVAALAFYALFALVEWRWIFNAAQVLTGIALASIWPETTTFLALNLTAGAAGLAIADHTRRPASAVFSFFTFWGAYGFWAASHGAAENIGPRFLLLTGGFAMYLAWTPFERLVRGVEVQRQHLIVLGLNGAVYFGCSYLLLRSDYQVWLGLFAVAVAGVHLLVGMRLWKARFAASDDNSPILLALGIALSFLTLAIPIQFTGYRITLSWAVEAAVLVWIGRRVNEVYILVGAAAVYAFAFFRLFGFDAFIPQTHPLLANSRFVTFLVSAVSFWLGAWWLKGIRVPAAVTYIAGHFIMLSACLFEFNDWVGTSVGDENQTGVMAIGVSILMALYAIALIGIGVAWRSVIDRILGLGLIALVVLKLYLYDVWEASRLFRMAAFVSLGILLLLTSYLYSRFRPMIESWWKSDEAGK
jgi:uncharacterized membrane protein